jgi:hypothetical protein
MSQNVTMRSDNLRAWKSDGTFVDPTTYGSSKGCVLTAGTWFFELGGSEAPLASETPISGAHLQWAAAVAGTATIETSHFPAKEGGQGGGNTDTTPYSSTGWIQQNPSTAYVPVSGTGNSSAQATLTLGGTNAGEASFDIYASGRRVRIKLVLTVGGLVRCGANGKGV